MTFFNNLSIRYKLICTFSLFALLVGIFVFLFFPYRQKIQILKQVKENTVAISTMTADNLAASLEFGDKATALEVITILKANKDFVFSIVKDAYGDIFVDINADIAGTLIEVADASSPACRVVENVIITAVPILSRGVEMEGQLFIGTLYIGLSIERINDEINKNNMMALAVIIALVLILILGAVFVGSVITKPIHRVIEVSSNIAKGDFSSILEVTSHDEVGKLSGAINVMSNKLDTSIGELEKSEKKTKETRDFLENVINNSVDGIMIVDPQGTLLRTNKALEKMIGYTEEELIGKHISELSCKEEEYRKKGADLAAQLFKEGFIEREETMWVKKDGTIFPSEFNMALLKDGYGNILGGVATARDITERRQADNLIRESLQEKELLLKEIHHRVKNNMQVISSLIKLQSSYIKDQKYIEIFKESQNRIKAMALIHEKLYQSKDLVNIDFAEYVKNLGNSLIRSYGSGANTIGLKADIADVNLGVDSAMPCGLIINELVSNALKHAFPVGESGEIKITMRSINGSEIELIVSDNGVGFPEDIDFRKTESLGLQLVSTLTEGQLHGTVELKRDKGTEFKIKFKEIKYKKRI